MDVNRFLTKEKNLLKRIITCSLLLLAILCAASLWLFRSFIVERAGTSIPLEGLQAIQISSTEYPYFSYRLPEPHSPIFQDKKLSYKTTSSPIDKLPYEHYAFYFLYKDQPQILLHYSPSLNKVYDLQGNRLEPSPDLKEVLLDLAALYRQEVHKTYGALMVWEEADKIFSIDTTARITDIYTRASFYAQRKDGVNHADAQPLTANDTAIMKKIYGNRWSWDRKGIIVEVGYHRIAASMHGMPHGAGIIEDNNFPGHFCIHFLGSTIHGGGMDFQHHREILKAAGKLPLDDL